MKSLTSLVVRGFLPAALAAALLAAASGTALAQGGVGVGFVTTSGSAKEGATSAADTPPPLKVVVRARGLPASGQARTDAILRYFGGGATIAGIPASATVSYAPPLIDQPGDRDSSVDDLDFTNQDDVVLTITPGSGDNTEEWIDEVHHIKLEVDSRAVSPNPGVFELTIEDSRNPPTIAFTRTSATMFPGNTIDFEIRLGPGEGNTDVGSMATFDAITMRGTPASRFTAHISPRMSGSNNVDVNLTCPGTSDPGYGQQLLVLTNTYLAAVAMYNSSTGVITLPTGDGFQQALMSGEHNSYRLKACEGPASGFRDTVVEFAFDDVSDPQHGTLVAGDPLVVTIPGEGAPPTVSFATTSLLVSEGGSDTVAILVEGALSDALGSVNVKVSGEAALTLAQDGEALDANADGSFTVDFGGGANAILEITAPEDASLADGATKTATLSFADANGAEVGVRGRLAITVTGVTAVPALPLVGQLLLALLLAAGGARLRRRR